MVKRQNPIKTNSVMGLNECIKLKHIISNTILKIAGLHVLPVTCICVRVYCVSSYSQGEKWFALT